MNRQRLLVQAVGGGLVALIVLSFGYKSFVKPWQDQNEKLAAAEKEAGDKELELNRLLRDKRKLERYRLLGLPPNLNHGGSEYAKYLKNLLQTSGLTVDDLQGPTGTEVKTTPQQGQQAKKPGHIVLSYQVRARGEWPHVVAMLEKFQRTPLLHRIRNFTMERTGALSSGDRNAKLGLAMTVEAMVVNKSEQRPNNLWGVDARLVAADALAGLAQMPTGWSMVLRGQALLAPEMPKRNYADLTKLNPFVGPLPPAPPPPPVAVKKAPPPELDVKRYVELVMISELEQKASLRNLLVNVGEQRRAYTTLSPKFPYNTFQILDEDEEEVLVKGKVLLIAHRDLYFQVGDSIYEIHMGQNLAEAMRNPLSTKKIEDLGLKREKKTKSPEGTSK